VRSRTLGGLLAAAVLAAGCAVPVFAPRVEDGGRAGPGGASAPAPGVTRAPASWRPCPEVPRRLVGRGAPGMTYECATIAVPRDWAAPASGETYEIALLRVRAADQRDRIGSLLVNPGGPGASGFDTAVYLSFGAALGGVSNDVTRRFDLIGFDPRGVNRSSPLECVSDAQLDASFGYDPDPDTQAEFDGAVALSRQIAESCRRTYGDQLPLFATEQAAHDMDAIRVAVGDDKLTYLGYSYGTLLGATYAQLYPRNVRALVLDGAVDPRQDFVAGSQSQAKGFELAFDNFARWCAGTPDRCPLAPDARGRVMAAIERARTAPAVGDRGRRATSGWVLYAVAAALYAESRWPRLAEAIDAVDGGDPTGVFEIVDSYAERDPSGRYSNFYDALYVVNCSDQQAVPSVERIRQLQAQWRTTYPMFGASLAIGMLTCSVWQGGRDPYPTGAAAGAPPVLVVGTTGDPATPYEQSPRLAAMLGVGRLLTWEGESHTAYPKSRCVTAAVDAYLIDLTVPPDGTRCR
jgi:pimeloyl-ACP methyl ester carboxylesterase